MESDALLFLLIGKLQVKTPFILNHNIPNISKQELLLETLRVLKKGGIFAIHDLMSPQRYGDMNAFAEELKKQGYKKVELIDTANGMFMSRKEMKCLKLNGSTILYGIK